MLHEPISLSVLISSNHHQHDACDNAKQWGERMNKILKKVAIVLVACVLAFMAGYSIPSLAAGDLVRIGHREFAEQRIIGQLFSLYLESKGYKTEVIEYPSTWSIFTAQQRDNIDVYTDYTGALYGVIFNQSKTLSKDETYDYVKNRLQNEYSSTLLEPLGWNNTYVLSVRPDTAQKYRLKTISDLVPVSNQLILGSDTEFADRKDGLIGLEETYRGLNFRSIKPMNQAFTYKALADGMTDVNASYSTDGQIEQFGLVNLIDNKNFFPPYYVTPIVKLSFAEKNPGVVAALENLANQWTEAEITKYNYMVDEGQDPRAVAELMLREKGLM